MENGTMKLHQKLDRSRKVYLFTLPYHDTDTFLGDLIHGAERVDPWLDLETGFACWNNPLQLP